MNTLDIAPGLRIVDTAPAPQGPRGIVGPLFGTVVERVEVPGSYADSCWTVRFDDGEERVYANSIIVPAGSRVLHAYVEGEGHYHASIEDVHECEWQNAEIKSEQAAERRASLWFDFPGDRY